MSVDGLDKILAPEGETVGAGHTKEKEGIPLLKILDQILELLNLYGVELSESLVGGWRGRES